MDNLGFLGVAFGLVWLGIAGYLISLARRQNRIEERLQGLESNEDRDNNPNQ